MPVSETLLSVLKTWNADASQPRRDLSLVVEFYAPDAAPPFDPVDALECFSKGGTAGEDGESVPITFRGVEYKRELTKVGDIRTGIKKDDNNNSPTFSSLDSYLATFVNSLEDGIEDCTYVVRLLSRSQSVELDDTRVLFTGRCERNIEGDGRDFKLSAKQHLISLEQNLPPRQFSHDDPDGRAIDDPLQEGFPFIPEKFTGSSFNVRVPRGGFLGTLGFTKSVKKTLPVTSHSEIDVSKSVPLVGGRSKMTGVAVAYLDDGNSINSLHAWADGVSYGIQGFKDLKNNSDNFTAVNEFPQFRFGYKGGTNGQVPFTFSWPGNGHYSRTAMTASYVNGSNLDSEDSAPEMTCNIIGAVVPLPDTNGSYLAKTGSITAGSDQLEVADTHYRNGDELWINGAGESPVFPFMSGVDFFARVVSGGGTTTLTLDKQADVSVSDTEVRKIGFTDNPVHLARWIITDPYLMAFPESWMDDAENVQSAAYCDHYLEDEANTDRVALPDSENGIAGTNYRRLRSTSHVSPEYFRRVFLNELTPEPYDIETDYDFFDPLDVPPVLTPNKTYRRRYSANFGIVETIKAVDFLFDVLFPAFRGYLAQGSNSKIAIKIKKPADYSLITSSVLAGATEVPVDSVFAWKNSLRGEIIVGTNLLTSEIRKPTGARYSIAGNSLTLAVSGALTGSGATFAGGDGANTPATATLTVTGTGTLTATINGVAVTYTTTSSDTTSSAAAMLAVAISANPTLNPYVKAAWNGSTGITLTAKLGYIQFATPLAYGHDAEEEVLRIAMSFSHGASVQSNATRSNILKRTFKWFGTGSSGRGEYNQVRLKYRDSSRDYQVTEIRIPKPSEISGAIRPKEFNGTAIDNYHQAYRIAAGLHAEMVDSNLYTQLASNGEALTIDDGEVIAVTVPVAAGGFINLPVIIEKSTITEDLKIKFDCKRYLTAMYSDAVEQRRVPLPTTLSWRTAPPSAPTNLVLDELDTTATSATVRGTFDFGSYPGAQTAKVHIKRQGAGSFGDAGLNISPDEDGHGAFEVAGLKPGTHEFKVKAEARGLQSAFSSTEDITTSTSGELEVTTLNAVDGVIVDGNQVLVGRLAAVPDASASTGSTVSGTPAGTDAAIISALITQVNTLKAAVEDAQTVANTTKSRMETQGLIES